MDLNKVQEQLFGYNKRNEAMSLLEAKLETITSDLLSCKQIAKDELKVDFKELEDLYNDALTSFLRFKQMILKY